VIKSISPSPSKRNKGNGPETLAKRSYIELKGEEVRRQCYLCIVRKKFKALNYLNILVVVEIIAYYFDVQVF
jgi:hypothetical protein